MGWNRKQGLGYKDLKKGGKLGQGEGLTNYGREGCTGIEQINMNRSVKRFSLDELQDKYKNESFACNTHP